jgi:hypothetical protein
MAAVFLFGTIAYLSGNWIETTRISKVSVAGANLIPPKEIIESVGQSVLNLEKKEIDLNKVRNLTISHPYISECFAEYKGKGILQLDIVERIPAAIILLDNGNIEYIDRTASILPYRHFSNIENLPVISGISQNGRIDIMTLRKISGLLRSEEFNKNKILNNSISEINFNSSDRTITMVCAYGKLSIIFGKIEEIDEKFHKLSGFINRFFNITGYNNFKYIDLRWNDRIVTG